jgi:large subunit ribosomal protein L4
LANQRQGNASTKTRGEVDGSTRKIYRQKGTGNARHGGIRAPIFVKGGIVFGPKPRDFSLNMPQKMKRKALLCALSAKAQDSQVTVLSGLEDLKPKTKEFVAMLKHLGVAKEKQKLLFVTTASLVNAKRAGQNVQGVTFTDVRQLNAYEVLRTRNLVLDKAAIEEMKKQFLGKDK